jgi:CheY-like chemotaxis protein
VTVRTRVALILVVDDEFSVAEVLQSVLADAGHVVVMAVNGRQGLARISHRGSGFQGVAGPRTTEQLQELR